MLLLLRSKMENKTFWERQTIEAIKLGATMLAIVGTLGGVLYFGSQSPIRNKEKNIQEGYVSPSKLEIVIRDLDHNGKYETYLEYNIGKYRTESYQVLKEKERDWIVIKRYEIKPAEIISK
jgi:hypothetical protein